MRSALDIETPSESRTRRSARLALLALVLVAGVVAIYADVTRFEFVNYDDDRYVTANAQVRSGLTAESARWALTATEASNWHPLTWLSHMLDVELFELDAGAHHRTNVVWHAVAALALFGALARLTGRAWPSFFAAALFAWHPLRVESVAWVAERKDVLSGALGFLSLWAYVAYAKSGGAWRYALSLVALALGLAAKPMLVTLPCVFLLLDAWPLARARSIARRVVEKLPHFALAAASSWMTMRAQSASGATELLRELPLSLRVENAFAAFAGYLRQTVWPTDLACLYPHAATYSDDPSSELLTRAAVGAALVVVLTLGAWLARRKEPLALSGWLWTLGTLVPVIGLVQVGYQERADRYTYLPLVGAGIAVVFLVATRTRASRAARTVAAVLAAVALGGFAVVAREQASVWRDSTSLWTHCLAVTPPNFVAENNLGRLLADAGDAEAARAHFEESLRISPGGRRDPDTAVRRFNLAGTYLMLERTEDAIGELELAVKADKEFVDARIELARARASLDRGPAAVVQLKLALEAAPHRIDAVQLLADLQAMCRNAKARNGEEAVENARRVVEVLGRGNPSALATLAAALAEAGRWDEAIRVQERVVDSCPVLERPNMQMRLNAYRKNKPWRSDF